MEIDEIKKLDKKYGKELEKFGYKYDPMSEKMYKVIYQYHGENSKFKDSAIEIIYGTNGKLVFYLYTNDTYTNSYSMNKILKIIKCAYSNPEKSWDECINEVFEK